MTMAIAPLEDIRSLEGFDDEADLLAVWPRPVLTLVTAGADPEDDGDCLPAERREDLVYLYPGPEYPGPEQGEDLVPPAPALRRGADVVERRAKRQSLRVRRRRTALALVVGFLLAALLLPVSVLGGRAPDGASALPGALDGGTGVVYVVQPGDTLRSIAARVDPADPAKLAAALATQLGSGTVVPGEHLTLP